MNKKSKSPDTKTSAKRTPVNEKEWQQAVEKICLELDWKTKTQDVEGNKLIMCPLPNDTQFKGVLFVISARERRLAIYLSYRLKASRKDRNNLLEEISRINFGLLGGCLELDPESGEVRYRDSLLMGGAKVDIDLLRTLVAASLQRAMEFAPELEAIAGTEQRKDSAESGKK
jgi:hypothetical protein